MRTIKWREIREGLARQRVDAGMRDADDFWSDFRARARLVRQEAAAPAVRLPWLIGRRLAVAGAVAVLMLAAAGVWLMPVRSGAGYSRIKSLEVIAPHSGVIIMNDSAARGTILWVADLPGGQSG